MSVFQEKFAAAIDRNGHLCIGLDPEESRHLELYRGVKKLINQTAPYGAFFKPNLWFYLAHGSSGLRTLEAIVRYIRRVSPETFVILDGKGGDIANTAKKYLELAFDRLGADAVTINPYMGEDTVIPLLVEKYSNKGAFVLCRTSNESSAATQMVQVKKTIRTAQGEIMDNPLYYEYIASLIRSWNTTNQLGVVAGATNPSEISIVREIVGSSMPLLLPGVGAQGGDPRLIIPLARGQSGTAPFCINVGRGIANATDPAEAAREYQNQFRTVMAA